VNLSRIRSIYYPQTVPRPERLRRWSRKIDYGSASVVFSGEVSATRYTIPAPSPEAKGRRLAFAADFHYCGTSRDRRLAALAAERIREWRPDVFCFGGDLVADASQLDALPELLDLFRDIAPLSLAIPGNWERGKTWLRDDYWPELYGNFGIRYLCNSGINHDDFYYYGCDDLVNGDPRLPDQWPEGKTLVLLVHRPDTVIALDAFQVLRPVELILCGHTHGGQVRIPFIGPFYASSMYGCRLDYGLFERCGGIPRMIVSSGIGNRSFGFRFNCRREVVLIEFV